MLRIGFQLHPNKGINSAGPTKFDPEYAEYLEEKRAESIPEVPAKSSVIRAMEKATADVQKANEKVPKRMTFGEKDVVEALLAAHGRFIKHQFLFGGAGLIPDFVRSVDVLSKP
eukprot:SAG31_NODE_25_length_33055_cov_11.407919_14_plen_114_part_00